MPTRSAKATWDGGIKDGKGSFMGQTGLGAPYSFSSRFEGGAGSNPEELLAAAEASCFSMALALTLERAGHAPDHIQTEAFCTIDKVGARYIIGPMRLEVEAVVPGLDAATFLHLARDTKESCPVSVALGAIDIELSARLLERAA